MTMPITRSWHHCARDHTADRPQQSEHLPCAWTVSEGAERRRERKQINEHSMKRQIVVGAGCLLICIVANGNLTQAAQTELITVDLSRGPIVEFIPDETFGAALDGKEAGEVKTIYTQHNVRKMLSAGLRSVTYRLRTELGIDAWHWNEQGNWSDAGHHQGYWTSSDQSDQPILISHGYKLPRRGNTVDQAEDDGYSRLTDGDPSSFWKSNPYLDEHFTRDANAKYPQWVVIDLGRPKLVNAIKIAWGIPYATRFEVQYGTNVHHADGITKSDPEWNRTSVGRWCSFPKGSVDDAPNRSDPLQLADVPVVTRYVRILLDQPSGTRPPGSTDLRDALGFAIREIYLGVLDKHGKFHDEISHSKNNKRQTVTYASSTDPWHRAKDLDRNIEQPGFDLFFRSGLTNDLPALIPVGVLYDTPDNAAAEIRFLEHRGYPIHKIEMGEEPDGQQVSPEHDAALYLEFASAIHKVDPTLSLGGPSFQSGIVGSRFQGQANNLWVVRFLAYLRDHGRLSDYGFLSFEWYPFDNQCKSASEQLLDQPKHLIKALRRFREQGIATTIPWIISEYGFSAHAGRTLVEFPSALLDADVVGEFLTLGGKAAYLYGYEPSTPINEWNPCAGYGQMMLFEADDEGRAKWPMPAYFAMRLLASWAQPGDQRHKLFRTRSTIADPRGRQLVSSYALENPDGTWSVLMVNKDPSRDHSVRIEFASMASKAHFLGRIVIEQYSRNQYVWKPAGEEGHPLRSHPPHQFTVREGSPITLPAYSLTVVKGNIATAALHKRNVTSPPPISH